MGYRDEIATVACDMWGGTGNPNDDMDTRLKDILDTLHSVAQFDNYPVSDPDAYNAIYEGFCQPLFDRTTRSAYRASRNAFASRESGLRTAERLLRAMEDLGDERLARAVEDVVVRNAADRLLRAYDYNSGVPAV